MSVMFVGVDGEMSSSELANGGKLIQIGFTVQKGDSFETFCSTINPETVMDWQPVAAAVHGISLEEVKSAPAAAQVDDEAYAWLLLQGAKPKRRMDTVPVGFSVGSFDMPFVKDLLPKTFSLFSRRTLDLNALLYLLDGVQGKTFDDWKIEANRYAVEVLNSDDAHNAGWDSAMHLVVYGFVKNFVTAQV